MGVEIRSHQSNIITQSIQDALQTSCTCFGFLPVAGLLMSKGFLTASHLRLKWNTGFMVHEKKIICPGIVETIAAFPLVLFSETRKRLSQDLGYREYSLTL